MILCDLLVQVGQYWEKTLTDGFVCTKRHLTRLILIEYIDN